ncbi:MAG: NUDIX domain-containing protein [Thermoplasmata archaeon]|nr:NUDIX domain-containing protein [Thermoplasmata archaeon]MCI4361666.1 NUDIX domain-containing protein [Thermoplasmata archaeon]
MELGETVCLPRQPRCPQCPVATECRARQELPDPGVLPTRGPRPRRPHVVAAIVALTSGVRWLVRQRPSAGLLGGLWELPGGHLEPGETPETAASREVREETGLVVRDLAPIGVVRHAYSHFTVELHLFRGGIHGRPRTRGDAPLRWVTRKEFERLPRPAATVRALALLDRRPAEASRDSGSRRGRTGTSSRARSEPQRPRAPGKGTPASRSRRRAPR